MGMSDNGKLPESHGDAQFDVSNMAILNLHKQILIRPLETFDTAYFILWCIIYSYYYLL